MRLPDALLIEWQLTAYLLKVNQDDGRVGRMCDNRFTPFGGRHRDDFTVLMQKAAKSLIAQKILVKHSTTEWGDDYCLAKGTVLGEKPDWKPGFLPKLEARDIAMLGELDDDRWSAPIDVGGRGGSYHSLSLQKLVAHGYAVCRDEKKAYPRPPSIFKRAKGSNKFKRTPKGKKFFKNLPADGKVSRQQ